MNKSPCKFTDQNLIFEGYYQLPVFNNDDIIQWNAGLLLKISKHKIFDDDRKLRLTIKVEEITDE